MMRNVSISLPENTDAQLVVCASLSQAAATIWAAGLGEVTEEDAINKALSIYAGVVNRLEKASQT